MESRASSADNQQVGARSHSVPFSPRTPNSTKRGKFSSPSTSSPPREFGHEPNSTFQHSVIEKVKEAVGKEEFTPKLFFENTKESPFDDYTRVLSINYVISELVNASLEKKITDESLSRLAKVFFYFLPILVYDDLTNFRLSSSICCFSDSFRPWVSEKKANDERSENYEKVFLTLALAFYTYNLFLYESNLAYASYIDKDLFTYFYTLLVHLTKVKSTQKIVLDYIESRQDALLRFLARSGDSNTNGENEMRILVDYRKFKPLSKDVINAWLSDFNKLKKEKGLLKCDGLGCGTDLYTLFINNDKQNWFQFEGVLKPYVQFQGGNCICIHACINCPVIKTLSPSFGVSGALATSLGLMPANTYFNDHITGSMVKDPVITRTGHTIGRDILLDKCNNVNPYDRNVSFTRPIPNIMVSEGLEKEKLLRKRNSELMCPKCGKSNVRELKLKNFDAEFLGEGV